MLGESRRGPSSPGQRIYALLLFIDHCILGFGRLRILIVLERVVNEGVAPCPGGKGDVLLNYHSNNGTLAGGRERQNLILWWATC